MAENAAQRIADGYPCAGAAMELTSFLRSAASSAGREITRGLFGTRRR